MTDQNTTQSNAKRAEAHRPGADATSPFHAAFGALQRESLRVADEAEKMLERSMQEMKRANHEGARMWEAQLELSTAFTRAWFDGVRRMNNF